MASLLEALLVSCILVRTSALVDLPHRARGGLAWQLRGGAENLFATPALTFDALLDNNHPNSGTFKNRYYLLDRFYSKKPGYCFMNLGGEGPNNGIGNGYVTTLAKKHRALVVSIEHRFYGQSVPGNNMTVSNLRHLTSRQALADTARLINIVSQKYNCTWFTFGGSYSGALSAWFREKYPTLTQGSLSSSGVVNAIYGFTAFDQQVATAIGNKCASTLRQVTAAFEALVKAGKLQQALAMFNAEKTMSAPDFFYMIADGAAMADQYGHKANLCNALAQLPSGNQTALMEGFAHFINSFWGQDFGANCFYNTACLKNDTSKWQPTSRAWRWQKCNELAYFQVAPRGASLRSGMVNLQYHLDQCAEVFDNATSMPSGVVDTNHLYGGANPNTTHVFYSDFSDDPWQRASVNRTIPKNVFSLVQCDGCGHCLDLGAPTKHDPQHLKASRAEFEAHMLVWLDGI